MWNLDDRKLTAESRVSDDVRRTRKEVLLMEASFAVLLSLTLLVGACVRPPQKDVDKLESSLEKLRNAKAESYIPDEFGAADKAYQAAVAEIEAQYAKRPWSRSYDHAKELVAEADTAFETARSAMEDAKEEAHGTADSALAEARESVDVIETAIKKYPDARRKSLEERIDKIRKTIEQGETAFDAGDYLTAQSKADDAQAATAELSDDIGADGRQT